MPRRKSGDKVVVLSFRANCAMQSLLRRYVHDRRQQEYTSIGQVMRDAVEKYLKEKFAELAKSGTDCYEVEFSLMMASRGFEESEKQQTACEQFMDKTINRVNKLSDLNATPEIRKLLIISKAELDLMPDNYWTRRLRTEWQGRFGGWVPLESRKQSKTNGKEEESDRIDLRPSHAEPDEV